MKKFTEMSKDLIKHYGLEMVILKIMRLIKKTCLL